MRAQVVLLQDVRILLARHERPGSTYWVLPGGEVEDGENPEEAATREVEEETGLQVAIERLLFVDGPRQAPGVEIKRPRYTYLGRIIGGDLRASTEEEGRDGKGRLCGADWMRFDSPKLDEATKDTLALVKRALAAGGDSDV